MENEQKPVIPDFMQDYFDGIDEEGQILMEREAARYEHVRQEFMQTTFASQSNFQTDWNNTFKSDKRLDPDAAVSHIKAEYKERARSIAVQHGYVEKTQQPQPSAQAKHKRQKPIKTKTQQPANAANELPKQQANQQAGPPNQREAFLQSIRQQRQRQAQARQPQQAAAPPAPQPAAAATPTNGQDGNRERFLKQLQTMREQSQQITQRPR